MNARRGRSKKIVALAAAVALATGVGIAYWGTGSAPGGGGSGAATTVNPGPIPTVSVTGGTSVTVSWTASTMSSGTPVTGYAVNRYDAGTGLRQTILSACTGVVATTSCTESNVPEGQWRYTVTPVVGTSWTGAESTLSAPVSTDSTAPMNKVSLSDITGNAVLVGNTVYYRGSAAGSFKIVNALTDAGTGPASSATSALSGTSTGWSHAASTIPTPSGGPYTSNSFSWTAGTSSSPSETVTGTDQAGNSATTTLTFTNDPSGPTGVSAAATGLVGAGAAYSTSTTVTLALSKGSDPSGLAVTGAQLMRATATLSSSDGISDGTCGTFGSYSLVATDPIAVRTDTAPDQSCVRYQYVVSDALGNATTYQSLPVKVDTTAPSAPSLVFTSGSNTYWPSSGSTVYYRPSASSGGFALTATGIDSASGISSYSFPSLGSNWTLTPGGGGAATYAWSGSPATPGTKTVMVTNNATLTSSGASFTPTADGTAPSTGTISYPNAPQSSTSVAVSFAPGTDTGSGIGTSYLQRASATLTGSSCGTFGGFSTIATNPTSPYTDTGSKGNCYKYQYLTSDNVGNQTTTTSPNVVTIAKRYVDTVIGTSGLLSYWRLGEAMTTGDTFTGTAGTTLQSHIGEINATWTKNTAVSTGDIVLTAAGRIRKNGNTSRAVYYSSGVPPSADYMVQADLTYVSSLSNDRAGVLGRVNTSVSNGTFYAAAYDRATTSWRLYSVVNGAWSSIGSSSQTLSAGTTYRLTLQMVGTAIKVYVDGVQVISVTSNTITAAGRAGVTFGNGSYNTNDTDSAGMHLDYFEETPRMSDSYGGITGDYFGPVPGVAGAISGDTDTSAWFGGVNDFATVNETMTGDFSVEFWFASAQGIGTGTTWQSGAGLVDANISGNNKDWGTSLRSDGKIIVGDGDGSTDYSLVSTTGGYNDGQWHHVVFTRTQSTGLMQLYVDGVAVGSATGALGTLTAPTISFGRINTPVNYFAGYLDEVSLYNTALPASTVSLHYAAGH